MARKEKLRSKRKSGPCRHCGVASTPLWRNGPYDKPVLCNACGTRWRTKGSLVNYTPMHVREPIYPKEYAIPKAKRTQLKLKGKKILKIKQSRNTVRNEREIPYQGQNFRKPFGIIINRSSSESATSYSESCANFDAMAEASDFAGSAQSNVWEPHVLPMKRAHEVHAKPTPVEMLANQLHAIMQEQQHSNEFSSPSDLLFENESHVGSLEIGSGSVLLRNKIPNVKKDESEASSAPFVSKSSLISGVYSGSESVSLNKRKKNTLQIAQGVSKREKPYVGKLQHTQDSRDKSNIEKLHYIQDKDSPLGFADLKDILNFEVLEKYMTDEEKQQLKKHLASVDTDNDPLSIEMMFDSQQFSETFTYFQQLLQEGIFEPSTQRTDSDEFNTLKNLVVRNYSRSAWVVHYQKLKSVKGKENDEGIQEAMNTNTSNHPMLIPLKRSWEATDSNISGLKSSMRSLEKVDKSYRTSGTDSQLINYNVQEFADNDGPCLGLRSTYSLSPENSSMLCTFQSSDDKNSSNRDLIVHNSNNIFAECQLADGEESCFSFPDFDFSSQAPENR